MKFCTSCNSPLEFFEFLDGDLCAHCLAKKKEKPEGSPSETSDRAPESNGLGKAAIGVEKESIVIRSREGWILWSGSAADTHQLQTILKKARRIQDIRTKRTNQN